MNTLLVLALAAAAVLALIHFAFAHLPGKLSETLKLQQSGSAQVGPSFLKRKPTTGPVRRPQRRQGVATVEYALILTLISVFGISSIQYVGTGLNRTLGRMASQLSGESAGNTTPPSTSDSSDGGLIYRPNLTEEEGEEIVTRTDGTGTTDDSAIGDSVSDAPQTVDDSEDNGTSDDRSSRDEPSDKKVPNGRSSNRRS